jgi:hypothetical protein
MVFDFYSSVKQVRNLETNYREVSDIYDISGVKGLSDSCIQKLPMHRFHSRKMIDSCDDFCCSICLQVNINISSYLELSSKKFKSRKKNKKTGFKNKFDTFEQEKFCLTLGKFAGVLKIPISP